MSKPLLLSVLTSLCLLTVTARAEAQQPRGSLMLNRTEVGAIDQARKLRAALRQDRASLPQAGEVLEAGGPLKLSHVILASDGTVTVWLNGRPLPSGWTARKGEGEAITITSPNTRTGLSLMPGQRLDLPTAR